MTALKKRRPWYLRPVPVAVVLASLLFIPWFVFGRTGAWDSWRLHQTKQVQAERVRLLEQKKQQLQLYLTALNKGDEKALERAAREQNFAGSNETIYEIRVEKAKP
jgi:cell division protein FtsB